MFTNFVFSGNLLGAAGNIGNDISGIIFQSGGNRAILGIIGFLAGCLQGTALGAVGGPVGLGIGCLVGGGIGGAVGTGTPAAGAVISGIVYLVLLFGLLQAMFRLLFSLIGAYVSIILNTILGPFIILYASVPGNGAVLTGWWRGILANVLVFPAVFGLFLIIAAILGFDNPWYLNNHAVLPFNQALPLFGGSNVGFIQVLLAYGMLLVSPGIPDMVRDALHAGPNRRIEAAQQQGIRGGTATGTATLQAAPGLFRAGRTLVRGL